MSKHQRQAATFTLVVIGAMAAGCNRSAAEAKAEQVSPAGDNSTAGETPPKEAESRPEEMKEPARGQAVLARYESIRAALAKDAIASTTAEAAVLEKSARSAASAAEGGMAQKWSSVADAAKRLHEMSKDDADAVRKAFGDVSRQVLVVLTADKSLAEGLHVFECPMAQGYKKWVQPAAKISNPYMGMRMPECGSESSL